MSTIAKIRIYGVFLTFGSISLSALFVYIPASRADPVWNKLFKLKQPNGEIVEVRIWGDEFYRVVESLDGFTLVRDPDSGVICFARLSPDGNSLVSTGVEVHSASGESLGLQPGIRINPDARRAIIRERRMEAKRGERRTLDALGIDAAAISPPDSGNVMGICLIVDFSDEVATIPASDIDDYCSLPGYTGYGNNGSVRDYFYEVSDGNLIYTNYVPTAYYRAQNPKSYYDDCVAPYGERAQELILEALNDMETSGFDFSQYDSNGDGLIDAINCFYAGVTGCGWALGLWPHSWTVDFSADGVSSYLYQIAGIGSSLSLRTFCHENGHMICYWPDLYDYDFDSRGVGKFCLMCFGTSDTNPQEPSAYCKYLSGWTTTNLLTAPQTGVTVPSDVNTIYKYQHPALTNEYYLIENRQKAGRDLYLPDDGIAIWHIDTQGSNNNQEMTPESHYEVTLVQADGNWDLESNVNTGDATDLWSSPGYVECTPFTTPNTNWWDGSPFSLSISEISGSSTSMTFNFNPYEPYDGMIVAWGRNVYGQCNVPAPNADFVAVAGGYDHSLGLKSDGTVVGWGWNIHGECDVPSPNADFVAIAAGTYLSLGLKSDGTVVAWGRNDNGQCNVPAPNADFAAVAAGADHSLGLKFDGTIVAWGWNGYGQCDVPSPNADFVAVEGGASHSLGLKSDRTIVAWGRNDQGECRVLWPNADFVAIAAGWWHNLGIKGSCPLVYPNPLDFGSVAVGCVSDKIFTITNTSGDTLSGSISESCDHYSIVSGGGPYALAAGESIIVTVRYEPTATGTHECMIETGESSCSDVQCTGEANLGCLVQPLLLDFGIIAMGDSVDLDFTIYNIGCDTLFGSVSEPCLHYSVVSGGGSYAIPLGDSLVVTVRFKPTLIGTLGCTVMTGTKCMNVSCQGISLIPPPACLIDPDTLDFGSVSIGDFKMMTFDITNTGYGTLTGNVSESCPYYGVTMGSGSFALTHDQTHTVSVLFFPGSAGTHTCTIETGNDICSDVFCTGIGESPAAACLVEPDTLEFGAVSVNDSLDMTFFVTNTGGDTLQGSISEICDQYSIVNGGGPFSLAADETLFVGVQFKPTSVGSHNCTIDTGDSICINVVCTGTGDPPSGIGTTRPLTFALNQNYPNPFNPTTVIRYDVPASGGKVILRIYDVKGRLVRTLVDGYQSSGQKTAIWHGRNNHGQNVVTGVYFYRMTAPGFEMTKKLVLLK